MKWVLIVVGGLLLLVALAAAIGSLLPKAHVASRTAHYRQPPEAVWAAITDYKNFHGWRTGLRSVEPRPEKNGWPQWKEVWSDGTELPLDMIEFDPPRRMVTRIANPDLPFGGTWTYEIAAEAGGCSLTITERGEVYNPIFRPVSRLTDPSATIRDYQVALGRKFGEQTTSERRRAE